MCGKLQWQKILVSEEFGPHIFSASLGVENAHAVSQKSKIFYVWLKQQISNFLSTTRMLLKFSSYFFNIFFDFIFSMCNFFLWYLFFSLWKFICLRQSFQRIFFIGKYQPWLMLQWSTRFQQDSTRSKTILEILLARQQNISYMLFSH